MRASIGLIDVEIFYAHYYIPYYVPYEMHSYVNVLGSIMKYWILHEMDSTLAIIINIDWLLNKSQFPYETL